MNQIWYTVDFWLTYRYKMAQCFYLIGALNYYAKNIYRLKQ